MLRVKDENGNIIPGLFKDSIGSIIVKDDSNYNAYVKQKQQQEIINNLTKEVSELKGLIEKIISSTSINKNSTEGH